VVGSGASGLRAAIEVAEAGVAVVVVTQWAREDTPDAMVWSATTGVRRTSLWPAPNGITEPWRDASDDAGPAV
jgi:succinate dehydrogenase/fumarate reductase flavoprotein subunit